MGHVVDYNQNDITYMEAYVSAEAGIYLIPKAWQKKDETEQVATCPAQASKEGNT